MLHVQVGTVSHKLLVMITGIQEENRALTTQIQNDHGVAHKPLKASSIIRDETGTYTTIEFSKKPHQASSPGLQLM